MKTPILFSDLSISKIRKGMLVRMNALFINWRIVFPALKNDVGEKSILIFSIPTNMPPLIDQAKYDVKIGPITVTKTLTKSGRIIISAMVKNINLVESENIFFDPKEQCLVVERRSGRVIIGARKKIPAQETEVLYYDPGTSAGKGFVFVTKEIRGDDDKVYWRKILSGQTKRGHVRAWKERNNASPEEVEKYKKELEKRPTCPPEEISEISLN